MHLDPSTVLAIRIGVLLLFVALNGFFVAAEFALVKIRETQLEPLMAKGNRRARIAVRFRVRSSTGCCRRVKRVG